MQYSLKIDQTTDTTLSQALLHQPAIDQKRVNGWNGYIKLYFC